MIRINQQLLSWASILEDQAREQAVATSRLPFIAPHVALMPDAHWGMGSTVGSVIPTVGVVMPAAVGVDIGCGMAAVRTQLTRADVDARGDLARLRVAIQDRVPVSPGVYRPELTDTARTRVEALEAAAAQQDVQPDRYSGRSAAADWRLQLGTLGGGNGRARRARVAARRLLLAYGGGSPMNDLIPAIAGSVMVVKALRTASRMKFPPPPLPPEVNWPPTMGASRPCGRRACCRSSRRNRDLERTPTTASTRWCELRRRRWRTCSVSP